MYLAGPMELFSVAAKLFLDRSEYDSDVKEADRSGKTLAENLSNYMEKAKKVISALDVGLMIKKAAGSIWDLAKETSAAGDRIDKQSQALGMSRKAYQEWDYILAQSGASIDSMGMSMKTMNEAIHANSAETAAGLSKLGLSAAHLQSLSPEDQFETLVRAFQKMPAGAEKSRLAIQLFGRNAQSLMPLLNSSSDSIDELRKNAHDLGLIMSDEDVDASVAFGDALDDLGRTWNSLKYKIGAQLLPGFTGVIKNLTTTLGNISTALVGAIKTGDWGAFFQTITTEIENLIPGMVDTVVKFVQGLFENADKLLGLATNIVIGLADGIISSIPILVSKLPEIIDAIWNGSNGGQGLKGQVEKLWGWVLDEWTTQNGGKPLTVEAKTTYIRIGWNLLSYSFRTLGTWTKTAWKATVKILRVGWTTIRATFNMIGKWVDTSWKATVSFSRRFWTLITNAFDELGKWTDTAWKATVSFSRKFWTLITNAFDDLAKWTDIAWKATVSFSRKFWTLITNAFDSLTEWTDKAWKATVTFVRLLWKRITDAFDELTKWTDKAWKATVSFGRKFWTLITNAFDELTKWVDRTWDATVTFGRKFWGLVSGAFNSLIDWVGRSWDITVTFSRKFWGLIANSFDKVDDWLNKKIEIVVTWIQDTWQDVKTAFNVISAWLVRKSNDIKVTFLATVDEWIDRIKAWIDNVTNNISIYLKGEVSEWIKRIYEWINKGINIAVNFTSGVGNAANFAGKALTQPDSTERDVVTGLGNLLWKVAFRHAKGLNYVPYNGYPALLDRGETVLNQSQGREWRQNGGASGINSQQLYGVVASAVADAVRDIQINLDGRAVGDAVAGQVGRNLYQSQRGRRFA